MATLPGLGQDDLATLDRYDEMTRAAHAATFSPGAYATAVNVSQIARSYPGLSPGVAYAFGAAGQSAASPNVAAAWQLELAQNLEREPGTVKKVRKDRQRRDRRQRIHDEGPYADATPEDLAVALAKVNPNDYEAQRLLDAQVGITFARMSDAEIDRIAKAAGLPKKRDPLDGYSAQAIKASVAQHRDQAELSASGVVEASNPRNLPVVGEAVGRVTDVAKPVVRTAALVGQAGYEGLQGALRTNFGRSPEAAPTFSDPLAPARAIAEQTTVGQAVGQLARGEPVDVGGGYLPSLDSTAAQAQADAARKYSPYLIGGHAWTPGRAVANVFFSPDDDAFAISSGLVDASVALSKLDPASAVLGAVGEARAVAKTFSTLTEAEYQAAGAVRGVRALFSPTRYSEWKVGNKGQDVIDQLAKTSDHFDIHHATGIPYYLADGTPIVDQLAKAKTATEVDQVLAPHVGSEIRNVFGFNPVRVKPRLTESVPGFAIPLGPDADLNEAALQADRVLVNSRAPLAARKRIANLWAQADTSRPKQYAALEGMEAVVEEQLVAHGVNREVARALTRRDHNSMSELIHYGEDWAGEPLVNPAFVTSGSESHAVAHPLFDNQFINSSVPLPDSRTVRRAVSGFAPYFNTEFNKGAVALGDAIMAPWRKLVLMRPAWGVRVVAEEQARIAAYGLQSLYHHPMSFASWVIGNPDDRWIDKWEEWGQKITPSGRASVEASKLRGEIDLLDSKAQLSAVEEARVQQLTDQLVPIEERAAHAGNVTNQFRSLKHRIGRGGNDYRGVPFGSMSDPNADAFLSSQYKRFSAVKNQDQILLREFPQVRRGEALYPQAIVEEIARTRESKLARAFYTNDSPDAVKAAYWDGNLKSVREFMGDNPGFEALKTDPAAAAKQIDLIAERLNVISANGNPTLVEALRTGEFQGRAIMENGEVDKRFVNYLTDEIAANPQAFPAKMRVRRVVTLNKSAHNEAIQKLNAGMDWLFEALMPRPSNYLSRSPFFRQTYWAEGERLLPYMDEASRARLIESAREANLDRTTIQVLEDKHTRLSALGDDGPEAVLDLEHADILAKRHALTQTKNLLYDLSERSQFFDSARLIFPFGEAWREIITRWAKLLWDRPQTFRRTTQVIQGARGAESDAINKTLGGTDIAGGFFHKNEFSDEVFSYPGSELLTRNLLGVPVPLAGSVGGLNLVGQGLPGIGPVVQVPLSYLLPDKPEWDWLANIVHPYGDRTSGNPFVDIPAQFLPSWADKLRIALSNPDTTRIYGNTVFDVARYLQSTGEYELQGPAAQDEMNRLMADAKAKAKGLYIIRAIGQATLPSSPSPEWLTHDKKGRLTLQWRAAKWYYDELAKPDSDPKEAYTKFLDRFGLNNFLLIQPKSKSLIPAPPQTTDASAWVRANPDLAKKYPHVYGLFAPTTGEFDQTAYERQFERGERAQLTPDQMTRLANARLAQTAYANVRAQYPENPNQEQAAYLRKVRADITRDFPGYQDSPPDYGKTDRLVVELKAAARDPKLAATDAGKALKVYLKHRQSGIRSAQASGLAGPFQAKAAQPIRDWLNEWGDDLVTKYPGFQPMWDLVFSHEVA